MTTVLAVTGLLLDRAFPYLSPAATQRRRGLTMSAIVNLARIARERNVDAVVVVGGLFDERSVGIQSVPAALQILGGLPSALAIAPGSADPFTADGLYATSDFPDGTHIWTSANLDEFAIDGVRILGRARRGLWDSTLVLPHDMSELPTLVLGDGLPIAQLHAWVGAGSPRFAITTADVELDGEGLSILAPVNADLGRPFGSAALITVAPHGEITVERVPVLEGEPSTIEVDVAPARSTESLLSLLTDVAERAQPWSVLRLTGMLRAGVMLPSVAENGVPRDDLLVDESALEFEFVEPDRGDRTAQAEFVRSLLTDGSDDRARHQAIAFGLAALQATVVAEVAL